MQQGYISNEEWIKLTTEEKESLESIRFYFENTNHLFDSVNPKKLAEKSFEAMGKRFRARINSEVASYGRYSDVQHDGFFLIIQSAIGSYDTANLFFPPRVSDTRQIYQQFKYESKKHSKNTVKSIKGLEETIDWLNERTISKFHTDQLNEVTEALAKVAKILELQLKDKKSINFPHSSVENFVESVCGCLVWFGEIKPTKPVTDAGDKTPLLRFLEIFYPLEAEATLSRLYEKQKKLAPNKKIGSSFLSVK